MPGNTFGNLFRLTTFGESHGAAIGGIIDGCPSGLELDLDAVQLALDRRKPGQSALTTQRKESDTVQWLSGIFDGKTTGTPIGFLIVNADQNSKDYDHLAEAYRPSHADFTYEQKYGHRDFRGGGRSSARETACRVVAGAVAAQLLKAQGVEIMAFVSQVHNVYLPVEVETDLMKRYDSPVRCPHDETAAQMIAAIEKARDAGDSLGGVVSGLVTGVPPGWGEPVFDKLHADLAKAMVSINAVKGFEIGSGFAGTRMKGSEHNDAFYRSETGNVRTRTNFSGGIQGGISNGEDLTFRVAFKPTATLLQTQQTIDKRGNSIALEGKGRHDPCVLPRAVPIVEAMAALVLADHYLRNKSAKL